MERTGMAHTMAEHATLAGAVLLLAVTACGQQEEMAEPEDTSAPQGEQGQADPTPEDGDGGSGTDERAGAYVFNRYGNENGFDDQRPEDYVATEFTTFSDMEWEEWTDEVARGEGDLLGTWCMDQGCQDDPYDVEVELGDPVDVDGTTYFSTYTITDYDDDMPEEMRRALEDTDGGRLAVPDAE